MNYIILNMFQALVQLLMALTGAVLIAAGVQGFKAEWQALFKKPLSGVTVRIFVYLLSFGFQGYNWYAHQNMPVWEVVVLAFLTAFCASGIYRFAKKH